jgi:L-ribulose-5-phosphate 3-epimerase UlaE
MPAAFGFPEKLAETKAAGFHYLELSVDETDEKLVRLNWNDYRDQHFTPLLPSHS